MSHEPDPDFEPPAVVVSGVLLPPHRAALAGRDMLAMFPAALASLKLDALRLLAFARCDARQLNSDPVAAADIQALVDDVDRAAGIAAHRAEMRAKRNELIDATWLTNAPKLGYC